VNEDDSGVIVSDRDICKVAGCKNQRMKRKNKLHAFCKNHSGLRCHIKKKKFKELVSNNELLSMESTPSWLK